MKKYLIGFSKGFGVLVLVLLIEVILLLVVSDDSIKNDVNILSLVIGFAVIVYLVYRHKLHKSWIFLGLLFNLLLVPFLLGYIERIKST